MAKYFLDWIPLPNRAGRELNFVGTEQVETENQFMTKVEYNRQRPPDQRRATSLPITTGQR